MLYVLAYPRFDTSVAQRVADFRATHEPRRAKLVRAHLTLVFGAADEHLPVITDLVETASQQIRAFTVSFERHAIEFDPFEKTYKIFLLCGAGRDEVTSLHKQLYAGPHIETLSTAHPFRPHMTVASYETLLDVERIDVTQSIKFPIRSEIEALDIVRLVDGKLTTLQTTPLLR